jgi:hypothetical protein
MGLKNLSLVNKINALTEVNSVKALFVGVNG